MATHEPGTARVTAEEKYWCDWNAGAPRSYEEAKSIEEKLGRKKLLRAWSIYLRNRKKIEEKYNRKFDRRKAKAEKSAKEQLEKKKKKQLRQEKTLRKLAEKFILPCDFQALEKAGYKVIRASTKTQKRNYDRYKRLYEKERLKTAALQGQNQTLKNIIKGEGLLR